jgi:hypothetical protein
MAAFPPKRRLKKAFVRGQKHSFRREEDNPYRNPYLRKAWEHGRQSPDRTDVVPPGPKNKRRKPPPPRRDPNPPREGGVRYPRRREAR